MIENVNLSHCSPEFLAGVVRKNPLMESGRCVQRLLDAMCYHLTSPRPSDSPRGGYYNALIAIYDDSAYTMKTVESEWLWLTKASSVGKWFRYSSACMTPDGILITGGSTPNGFTKQCWKLTLPTMKWTALPDLFVARVYHATVCGGSQVYVVGGCDSGEELQSVEYLDDQKVSWHGFCDMPSGLYGHTAISYKHFIYVFGSNSSFSLGGGDSSLATFMLDTISNRWSRKADMPSDCLRGSAVMQRDRIYVLVGYQNCCMSYDPDQEQRKTHSRPEMKHDRASAVVWRDRILLCGGLSTSVIEEYNPDIDTWSEWKHHLPKAGRPPPLVLAVHM